MHVLALDFGNTTIKAAFFEGRTLKKHAVLSSLDELDGFFQKHTGLEGIAICSVRKENLTASIQEWIATKTEQIDVLILDWQTALPIQNRYRSPKTLGNDRLAAVIGAFSINQKPTLVVDAGTCITYDFIEGKGIYEGGSISLGLQMRFKALHEFTANLPLLTAHQKVPTPIGTTTSEAIQAGVQFGLLAELKGIIDFYHQRHADLGVIFCGGDAPTLQKWWQESSFYSLPIHVQLVPELVLIGLQRIFEFTHQQTNL